MPTISIGSYTGATNRVDKSDDITYKYNFTFIPPEQFDLYEPSVRVDMNAHEFWVSESETPLNYVLIEWSGKELYYYIQDVTDMTADDVNLMLRLDPLMTYRHQIYDMQVITDRTSDVANINPFIIDTEYPVGQSFSTRTVVGSKAFSPDEADGTYIIVTSQDSYKGVD